MLNDDVLDWDKDGAATCIYYFGGGVSSPAFQVESNSLVQPNSGAKMGFWDGALAYSTIGAWLTNDPNNAYYVFVNAREATSSGSLTSLLIWGSANDQVEVVFDSLGVHTPGTRLNGQVLMQSYQVLLLKRL